MANNKAFKVKNGLDLGAYSKAIDDTALAVFVYDTRKDSDGGAWRKRTQHTSWYNETLNTSTRGSRKEFPAVAVIVAESNAVTIYDGDDPDLPMWMVFEEGRILAVSSTYQATAVTALNGTIAVSRPTYGISHVNFISERAVWYHNDTQERLFLKPITGRGTSSGGTFTTDAPPISNADGNDVAMVALPSAPIDIATGLPVPTFAVATQNRVSVIKDDGTVVKSNTSSIFESVMFNGTELYAEDTTFADDTQYYGDVGSLSDSFPTFRNFYSYTPSYEKLSSSVLSTFNGNILTPLGEPRSFAVGLAADSSTDASWTALNMVKDHSPLNGYSARTALVSYINTDFNTGWMQGDIKLATLSDTDDTDVTSSDVAPSSYNAVNTYTVTFTSGVLSLTPPGAADYGANATVTGLTSGDVYMLSYDVTTAVDGSHGLQTTDANGTVDDRDMGGVGSYTRTLVVDNDGELYIMFGRGNQGSTSGSVTNVFDNIILRKVEYDRTVYGNNVHVYGTITKSAVATGADLVAYSNFASNRYLRQPYNTDLDYGTGDFHYIWWATATSSSADRMAWGRGDYATTGSIANIYANSGSGTGKFFIRITGDSSGGIYSDNPLQDGIWHCYAFVARSGRLYLYIDGVQQANTPTYTQTTTLADAPLTLGNNTNNGTDWSYAHAGNLALFRTGATAPSPEQIRKIYEDEQVLFQDGVACTLYGSSDTVKALAYDDSTDLLHVGTSSGRSMFQGLRRVDNTTTAITKAVSASNGLVADE